MGYAIFRTQKLKAAVAVRASLKHALREQDTPNADAERTQDNDLIGAKSVDEALAKFGELMPEKVRKNAVMAVEYLITGSPEEMKAKSREAQDAYLLDGLKWIQDKHGATNVFFAAIHRDESTPHLSAFVVPLDERGKLNCRKFLGGSKEVMRDLQTDFAAKVGVKHGLERGLERSKARHTAIREHYANLNNQRVIAPKIALPEPEFLEGKEKYAKRVSDSVIEQIRPDWQAMAAKETALKAAQERLKALERSQRQLIAEQKKEKTKLSQLNARATNLIKLLVRGSDNDIARLKETFKPQVEALERQERSNTQRTRNSDLER